MTTSRSSATFILFDLDGTLVDPAPGIIGSVQHALRMLGHAVPPDRDLTWVIGPPLRQSFARLLGSDQAVEDAVDLYRDAYSDGGLYRAAPYLGIFDVLAKLKRSDHDLFLCTAKPRPFARKVIDHFVFAEYFEEIYGAELDGRFDDKGELISHILTSRALDARDGCIIGDRANDTLAAQRNGMTSIGVTWGYGSHRELLENGATILCEQIGDLPDRVAGFLGR